MEIKPTFDFDVTVNYANADKIANLSHPPIILSILIATMPSRSKSFWHVFNCLEMQHSGHNMEIITDSSMEYNIGAKRNKLLEQAKGEYIIYVDDDDTISHKYVSLILEACKSGSDCIGINGTITTNGHDLRKWFISKEYGKWFTGNDGTYYRTPNHISPVKRELALKVGFPEIHFGEDAVYSDRLLPFLKTETIIQQPIYHYDYWQK